MLRLAKRIISIAAILLLPFLTVLGVDRMTNPIIVETSSGHPDRLMHHYDVMTNIFAYECSGQPLRNVQLFDQDGRPLDIFGSHEKYALVLNGPGALIPHPFTTSGSGWNVYPLDAADLQSDPQVMQPDLETIWTLELPYQSVQPLVNADELCGNQGATGGENGTEDMLEESSADVALPEDR